MESGWWKKRVKSKGKSKKEEVMRKEGSIEKVPIKGSSEEVSKSKKESNKVYVMTPEKGKIPGMEVKSMHIIS
jgi:hypothetical protein